MPIQSEMCKSTSNNGVNEMLYMKIVLGAASASGTNVDELECARIECAINVTQERNISLMIEGLQFFDYHHLIINSFNCLSKTKLIIKYLKPINIILHCYSLASYRFVSLLITV